MDEFYNDNHYKKLNPEPIDVILKWNLDFIEGNIIKYIARYKFKNGLEDLYKAQYYLNILIEKYKKIKK